MRSSPASRPSRAPNYLEVGAVVLTGALHPIVAGVLDAHEIFIAATVLGWCAYVVYRIRRDRRAITRWGFTRRDLRPAFLATSVVAAVGAVGMAGFALANDTQLFHAHLLPLLLLYPIWGLVQQFLVQALVADNLRRARGWIGSQVAVVLTCAVLFALVHVNEPGLIPPTFAMGLVFTPIYLRWRNLWPLGVYHGWLGALCYFWALGQDPWAELFARP